MATKPLVVIVGPTASGKTALAIDLAQKYNGEIICADSQTIYQGADIGTAKPSPAEQAKVKHWGLDLVQLGERFTAADFQSYAKAKIADIRQRQKVPFLVGGSGLYIDSVIFDFKFGADRDLTRRQQLEELSVEQLTKYCIKNNISLPDNLKNKRYLIRRIELKTVNKERSERPMENSLIVGITTKKEDFLKNIKQRIDYLVSSNVVEESLNLETKYGANSPVMQVHYYPSLKEYRDGQLTLKELKEQMALRDKRLAKKQLTWFRRNNYIKWLDLASAKQYLTQQLSSDE